MITGIQGGCIGGGLDLITSADIRFCVENAFFSLKEVDIGMAADLGVFPRLSRLVGDG